PSCCYYTDPSAPALYPLSLHDALPISAPSSANLDDRGRFLPPSALRKRFDAVLCGGAGDVVCYCGSGITAAHNVLALVHAGYDEDRKSTRLNSSHVKISYAVFCLKKKR